MFQLRNHDSGPSVTELKLLYTPTTAWPPSVLADRIGARTCAGCYEGHASLARIIDRSDLGGRASPPTPDSSPLDAPQKCNCQLWPLQLGPNLSRLHKCNSQLRTCRPCPERTRKSKCSLFPSCRGVIRPISATKQPALHFCNQLHFSVHPNGIANEGIRPRSYRGAHVSALIGSYAQRFNRSHWTADTWAVVDDSLARETLGCGRNGMRSANGENPPTNRRATAKRRSPTHSAEERETVRRGLRILARMIARAHLRRQASRSAAAPRPPAEDEEGD